MGQSSRVGPPGPLGVPPPFSGLRAFTDSISPAEDTFPSPPSVVSAPSVALLCHTLHSGELSMGGTPRAEMAPSCFLLTHGDHCAAWHAVGQWAVSTPWVDAEKGAGRHTSLPRGQTQQTATELVH